MPPPTSPFSKKDHINDDGGKDDHTHLFSKLSGHFFLFKNKLNSASQNICFSSSPFLSREYDIECKLFLSVICPSSVSVRSWHLSTVRHNQYSQFPQQLPGKTLEVVTYNVNLETWTTAQREAEKVSLHIFSVYNLNERVFR